MGSLNKVMLIGRLGRDPEMRYLQDGTAVATLSLATSEFWSDKNSGERREKTEWHRVVAFRRIAELSGEYLAKGKQVYIEGRLQTRSYEKDGITRYTTEIIADRMQFLDSANTATSQNTGSYSGASNSYQGYQAGTNAPTQRSAQYDSHTNIDITPGPNTIPDDDDIPF